MTTYFGDATTYTRLLNSTASSVSLTFVRGGRAYVISIPRIKLMGASPSVPGTNQDCLLQARYQALYDATTGYTISIDKLEYVE